MAKVSAPGSLSSTSLQICGSSINAGPMGRRKTPLELRGEMLKRAKILEHVDESVAPVLGSTKNANDVNGLKKQDLQRNKRCIETRMDEVYPVRKPRLSMLSVKESGKENTQNEQHNVLKNINLLPSFAKTNELSCLKNPTVSTEVPKDDSVQASQNNEKCRQGIFRSITEISADVGRSSSLADVDMSKALIGLKAREPSAGSDLSADASNESTSGLPTHSGNFSIKLPVTCPKVPVDFTLKSKFRVASASSIYWIYRSVVCSSNAGVPQFNSPVGCLEESGGPGQVLASQSVSSKALRSWVYPQSVLPPSVILALNSAATDTDFLKKRQLEWEDSFRSLYFKLRRNICSLFYVCTPYFVVMFTGGDGLPTTKKQCNAYISQSTRGLRSLLREHDVCFTMPLTHAKAEQHNSEDLVELAEIEKQNLGQTRQRNSLSDLDNSPESLLAFNGHTSVHGLFDFLLNYRVLLTSLSGVDVPVLYSPIPFENAASSAPEIRCVEARRAYKATASTDEAETKDDDSSNGASTGFLSSIEIKDSYIPPWIVSRLCALVGSEGRSFEASFMTESSSIGLNVALGTISDKSKHQTTGGDLQEKSYEFGVPEAIVCPSISSGFLKSLKYQDNSYTATVSPV